MVYYPDEILPGMLHDHMKLHRIKFWYNNKAWGRSLKAVELYIEDGDSPQDVLNALKKRYKNPEVIKVSI